MSQFSARRHREVTGAPKLLFYAYLTLIAWLPLPLGSNRAWAWSLFEVAVFSLAGVWILLMLKGRHPVPSILMRLKIPLLLMCAWIIYQCLQLVPVPPALLGLLSPATQAILHGGESVIGNSAHALSLDSGSTLAGILKNISYLLLMLLTLVLVDSRQRLRMLLIVLLCVGLGEALLGIAGYYGISDSLLLADTSGRGRAQGTYPNPNHYGALLYMSISATLGLLLASMNLQREGKGLRGILIRWVSVVLSPGSILIVALVTMFGALYLSQSRGASLSLFVALCVVILLGVSFHGRQSREAAMLPVVLVLTFGAALFLGSGELVERFALFQTQSEERLLIWQTSLKIFADFPVFGVGEGGFQWIFPAYEEVETSGNKFRYVHNDYLEILVDQGVAGALLLGGAMCLFLWRVVNGFRQRRDPFLRGVLFASLCACCAFLVHALFDFNFHIPANAAWFYVMLAAGMVASAMPSRGSH